MFLLVIAAPFLVILVSLLIGRYPVDIATRSEHIGLPADYAALLCRRYLSNCGRDIRLPRAILGAMVGGCLAISGAAFQGLFGNPFGQLGGFWGLVPGPDSGATLAIILFHQVAAIYTFAFLFGILAVVLSYMISRVYNGTPTIMLVLGGVIVSSVFSALLSLAKYLADPTNELPAIVFWLMGSLASARYSDIMIAGIPMLIGVAGLILIRWRINVLSMGDREAHSLGLNVTINKGIVIACATLATAGAVCVSGIIGWVRAGYPSYRAHAGGE